MNIASKQADLGAGCWAMRTPAGMETLNRAWPMDPYTLDAWRMEKMFRLCSCVVRCPSSVVNRDSLFSGAEKSLLVGKQ